MKGDIIDCAHCREPFAKRNAVSRFCGERCRVNFWLANQTDGCNENGCEGRVRSRGKCSKHYQALRAYERRHGVRATA